MNFKVTTTSQEEQESQEKPTEKILLLDLENCPSHIHELPKHVEEFSLVFICYAQTGAKIPLDWIVPLSTKINSHQLKIFKMPSAGKNAADFGICFFAGMLMQQASPNTHFVIASNDMGLDHVVALIVEMGKHHGHSAKRIGTSKSEAKTQEVKEIITVPPSVRICCTHLVTYNKNRPAREETLLSSINTLKNSKFNSAPESPRNIVDFLSQNGAITFSGTKVIYDDQKIKELANGII